MEVNKHVHCMWDIVGLTSVGIDCGVRNGSLYTRVHHYLDWIEEIVWPETENVATQI